MENNQTLKFKSSDPLNKDEVIETAENTIATLMQEEFIVNDDFLENKFAALPNEVKAITGNEDQLKKLVKKANNEVRTYPKLHIKGKDKTTAK
ncbi:hypothetical protein AAFM79_16320 [Trichormus azollae HNT15244]